MTGLGILGLQPLALDAEEPSAGSSDPVIVDVTGSDTGAVLTYTGVATHYRLNGGSSVAVGASPYSITGLTVNTEYTIEITADEITWTAEYDFGTDNSATGGGLIQNSSPGISSGVPLNKLGISVGVGFG